MFFGARFFQRFRLVVEMLNDERILVLKPGEHLEDGGAVALEAVVTAPLEPADLHRDLSQLVGVGIDLKRAELLHADLWGELEAERAGEIDDLLFQTEEKLERDIEKVTAATRGIEHRGGREFSLEEGEFFAVGLGALASAE